MGGCYLITEKSFAWKDAATACHRIDSKADFGSLWTADDMVGSRITSQCVHTSTNIHMGRNFHLFLVVRSPTRAQKEGEEVVREWQI